MLERKQRWPPQTSACRGQVTPACQDWLASAEKVGRWAAASRASACNGAVLRTPQLSAGHVERASGRQGSALSTRSECVRQRWARAAAPKLCSTGAGQTETVNSKRALAVGLVVRCGAASSTISALAVGVAVARLRRARARGRIDTGAPPPRRGVRIDHAPRVSRAIKAQKSCIQNRKACYPQAACAATVAGRAPTAARGGGGALDLAADISIYDSARLPSSADGSAKVPLELGPGATRTKELSSASRRW